MADVNAFLGARPLLQSGGLATIAAVEQGKESRYRQEDRETQNRYVEEDRAKIAEAEELAVSASEAWKAGRTTAFQSALSNLAAVDPTKATLLQNTFGVMDKTNFNEAGYHIYNAARADIDDVAAQDKSIERAMDALGVGKDHPFSKGLNDILAMPVKTKEDRAKRASVIRDSLEMAKAWNAFGGYFQEEDKLSARGKDTNIAYQRLLFDIEKEYRIAGNEKDKIALARRKQDILEKRGVIPQGYQVDPNNIDRLMPIPGSEADQQRKQVKSTQVKRWHSEIIKGERLKGQIEQAINATKWTTAGLVGTFMKFIPGTDSIDLNKTIQTIKANIGFDRLQKMRDESPTGGALGQVAIQELDALQNSIAALDQVQDPDKLKENLKMVFEHYSSFLEEAKKMHKGIQELDPNELWEVIPGTSGTPDVLSDEEIENDILSKF